MIPPLFGKQEVGIWRVKKRFPWYGVPMWSLWPNIRFLPSIVAEKNATKIGHIQNICSMCLKINKVGKQEIGIWRVQKRFPQYGIPIWSLWPNIRFLLPVCRLSWFLYKFNIHVHVYAHFSSHFSQQLLMAEIWYLVTSFI